MTRKDHFVLLVQTGVLYAEPRTFGPRAGAVRVVARAIEVDEAFIPADVESAATWFLGFAERCLDSPAAFSGSPDTTVRAGGVGGIWYEEWLEWRERVGIPPLRW